MAPPSSIGTPQSRGGGGESWHARREERSDPPATARSPQAQLGATPQRERERDTAGVPSADQPEIVQQHQAVLKRASEIAAVRPMSPNKPGPSGPSVTIVEADADDAGPEETAAPGAQSGEPIETATAPADVSSESAQLAAQSGDDRLAELGRTIANLSAKVGASVSYEPFRLSMSTPIRHSQSFSSSRFAFQTVGNFLHASFSGRDLTAAVRS